MKFFVPGADSPEQAQEIYSAIVKFAKVNAFPVIEDRRIRRLQWRHKGVEHDAEVGSVLYATGETVIAILDSVTYLVCTANRGVARGIPILVGKNEVMRVEEFERDAIDEDPHVVDGRSEGDSDEAGHVLREQKEQERVGGN